MQKPHRRVNTYVTEGDITYVYDQQDNMFMIDTEDLDFVKQYYWSKQSNDYIVRPKDKQLLHRLLKKAPKGKVVDHIFHKKYDNRKSQLRVCTYTNNQCNRVTNKNNKYEGVKGLSTLASGRLRVTIIVNKKSIYLGSADNIDEARVLREEAEIKYFGEYKPKECLV